MVTLPGQRRHLLLIFVSAWPPTASWRERVAKVLSFLCRSNYYDPIWILIFSNNGFFGYLRLLVSNNLRVGSVKYLDRLDNSER